MIPRYLITPYVRHEGGGWDLKNELVDDFNEARARARSISYAYEYYDWIEIVDLTIPAVVWETTVIARNRDKRTFEERERR